MKKIYWCIDNRLVHGQFVNAWLGHLRAKNLLIIDDKLVEDEFMSYIYCALVPIWMNVNITAVEKATDFLQDKEKLKEGMIVLARSPMTYCYLIERGTEITEIKLMDKMYLPNKLKVPEEYQKAVEELIEKEILITVQNDPEDKPFIIEKD